MRIERVALHRLELPLKQPFTTSFGTVTNREIVLVEVHCEGVTGWGEAPALRAPLYNEETTGTVWHVLTEFLAPAVLGQTFNTPAALAAALSPVRRHRMAKAALEGAFYDAWCRARNQPLWAALGGVRQDIPVGVSIGIQPDTTILCRTVAGYLEAGYRRIKLKIRPNDDVVPVTALRAAFGDFPLMVDANSAYRLADAGHLARLDQFNLMMIEQPLAEDDLIEHARLQETLSTPICLDESIETPASARHALALGSCRIINVKMPRLGGPTACLALHEIAQTAGVPLWCGGLMESGVGRAFNLALAALPGFTLPGDTSASNRYFPEDIVDPPAQLAPGGIIKLSTAPGIGCTVLPERVAKYRLEHWAASRGPG